MNTLYYTKDNNPEKLFYKNKNTDVFIRFTKAYTYKLLNVDRLIN